MLAMHKTLHTHDAAHEAGMENMEGTLPSSTHEAASAPAASAPILPTSTSPSPLHHHNLASRSSRFPSLTFPGLMSSHELMRGSTAQHVQQQQLGGHQPGCLDACSVQGGGQESTRGEVCESSSISNSESTQQEMRESHASGNTRVNLALQWMQSWRQEGGEARSMRRSSSSSDPLSEALFYGFSLHSRPLVSAFGV